MSEHPHKGKRSKWYACDMPPAIHGFYEFRYRPHGEPASFLAYWDGVIWSSNGRNLWLDETDDWRGLAEKPE